MNSLERLMDGLSSFLKSTWCDEDNFFYRVYMAQKCLNLNEYYFIQEMNHEHSSDEEKKKMTKTRNNTFISQYALLLKADELVEYYAAHKEFPRICVVDELILSGHDFCSLMYRMLDVIFDAWQHKYGEIGQEEYWVIRDAFVKSVTYKAYVCGEKGPLLDQSLPHIGEPKKRTGSEWRKYMTDVVDLLNESEEVENTSFTPTLWLPKDLYKSIFHPSNGYLAGWNNKSWEYGEMQADIWQKSIVRSKNGVRFHLAFVCKEADHGETVCVTPYAFWGKLSDSLLDDLFAKLTVILSQQKSDQLSALSEICAVPYRAATNSKLRFLYALICILELLELTQTRIDTLKHDLEKIAQNFGAIEKIYPAFLELCTEKCKTAREQLRSAIFETMRDTSAVDIDTTRQDRGDVRGQRYYLKSAEDYFIQVDYFERQRTQLRRDENHTFVPWTDFFYAGGCLSRYFKHFPEDCGLDEKVAAFILLAQRNVISFTISSQGDDVIYAKAGESTASMALYGELSIQKMSIYIPALIVLEKVCKNFGVKTENWAARFGSFLEKKGAQKGLGELLKEFVEKNYAGGSMMEDYKYVKKNTCDEDGGVLYRQQVYYQEQVAVFFRES